jgi:D-amino-acid dehydrogenase
VRWSYFPQALPWLFRFVTSTGLRNVEKTADALISLLSQTFDAHGPLAQHANCSDIIRKTGYVVVYDTDQAYRKDALAWKLRRDRGVVCTEIDAAGIAKLVPALARNFERGVYLPEQGYVTNPERLTKTYAQQFQKDGGVILQRDVLDIELGPNGPQALLTDAGRMEVDTLILCAGRALGKFSAKLGTPCRSKPSAAITSRSPIRDSNCRCRSRRRRINCSSRRWRWARALPGRPNSPASRRRPIMDAPTCWPRI